MNLKEQQELMIRLEESVKHIGEDVRDIKTDVKELHGKLGSFENIISEHKKYMEEHPQMCKSIENVQKRLDKKDTIKESILKVATIVNTILLLYFAYAGVFHI